MHRWSLNLDDVHYRRTRMLLRSVSASSPKARAQARFLTRWYTWQLERRRLGIANRYGSSARTTAIKRVNWAARMMREAWAQLKETTGE